MVNKIKSAFGGLAASALLATTALGQGSSTNMVNDVSFAPAEGYNFATEATGITPAMPVITSLKKTSYLPFDVITVSATNFNNGAAFYSYKSTNLIDWVKAQPVYSGSSPTSVVSGAYIETDPAYRKRSSILLSTTNVPSFKK